MFRRELTDRYAGMVQQILIYGSKARGESGPDSDLDVLVIIEDAATAKKREIRFAGYFLDAEGYVIPSIVVYTASEWALLKTRGSRFREAVERDKVPVL